MLQLSEDQLRTIIQEEVQAGTSKELIATVNSLRLQVERLEKKMDMHFSPTGPLSVSDLAKIAAEAIASGDREKIKESQRLVASL